MPTLPDGPASDANTGAVDIIPRLAGTVMSLCVTKRMGVPPLVRTAVPAGIRIDWVVRFVKITTPDAALVLMWVIPDVVTSIVELATVDSVSAGLCALV